MEQNTVISVKDVTMRFNMPKERVDSFKEYFVKLIKRQLRFEEFIALSRVSFDIKRGEVVGIVGLNGSGKSTLLKIISGILKPTEGSAETQGTISPLIELGAGFDFDLTTRENIYLNGSVLGFNRNFIKEKYDEILDFAELRAFENVAIKNFSSGMVARLGFAIATLVKPDILIVDEILAVGDFLFQLGGLFLFFFGFLHRLLGLFHLNGLFFGLILDLFAHRFHLRPSVVSFPDR